MDSELEKDIGMFLIKSDIEAEAAKLIEGRSDDYKEGFTAGENLVSYAFKRIFDYRLKDIKKS